MGYIYRFKNKNDEIIYVGKTEGENLLTRLGNHSHLPSEAYQEINVTEYAEIKNEIELAIYEMYYINLYKPKYNTIRKNKKKMKLFLPELEWFDSLTFTKKRVVCTRSELDKINTQLEIVDNQISALILEIEDHQKCIPIAREIVDYFQVKQCRITEENLNKLEEEWTTRGKIGVKEDQKIFKFIATKEISVIILKNSVICVHNYISMKGVSFINIADYLNTEDEEVENEKIFSKLYFSGQFLPFLYCIEDNIKQKILTINDKLQKKHEKLKLLQIERNSFL